MAECKCSGLHIGCEKSVVSGQYECVCGGNTQGEHCEQCLPFYNQQPFRQGESCEGEYSVSNVWMRLLLGMGNCYMLWRYLPLPLQTPAYLSFFIPELSYSTDVFPSTHSRQKYRL